MAQTSSDRAGRLGVCAAPECDRVSVDASQNGSRSFCSVTCQNRVKNVRHRHKQSAQARDATGSP